MAEVKNLQATLAHLRMRLQEEQEQLQKLVTTRANLEHEIRTKANSIFIDQEKCMAMRKGTVGKNTSLVSNLKNSFTTFGP